MNIRYIFLENLHSQDPQKILNSDIENLIIKKFAEQEHHDIVITTSIYIYNVIWSYRFLITCRVVWEFEG